MTLRATVAVGCLRSRRAYAEIARCLRAVRSTGSIRVVHYSVMTNHLHFLVEAVNEVALARGMQGLSIRMARALNRLRGRTGRAFADRYHGRILRTPRGVRRRHDPARRLAGRSFAAAEATPPPHLAPHRVWARHPRT
jgi:putative transposase